jgi:hypothetical protein
MQRVIHALAKTCELSTRLFVGHSIQYFSVQQARKVQMGIEGTMRIQGLRISRRHRLDYCMMLSKKSKWLRKTAARECVSTEMTTSRLASIS